MTETWKPVVGYEGLYEVSDRGRVRSVNRVVPSGRGGVARRNGRMLSLVADKDGYLKAHLCANGVRQHHFVHTLVCKAFNGVGGPGEEVRHLDGNRTNNSKDNLAWGTASENRRDCYRYGGRTGRGKLYREQVLEIRERLARGERKTDLAREYGVHHMNIHAIATGAHFSYI